MDTKVNVNLVKGEDLNFKDIITIPMKTNSEVDVILSSDGGLMRATNIMLSGGPGSGKTTIALDWLARLKIHGYNPLFISGEMDQIGYYKYCKRLGSISQIPVLFLKDHMDHVAPVIEGVLNKGYDIVVIDSIAEVLGMYRDAYKATETQAERWLLSVEDKHKMGRNINERYTSFINIQQTTKGGVFAGSNRLKHMMDASAIIERSKDGLERNISFSKNRDCNTDIKLYFNINNGSVIYSYEY